jgi:hypothetical protein
VHAAFAVACTSGESGAYGTGPLCAGVEHWQRIALLPGLELMLRADARQPASLAAQRIVDEYVVTPMQVI